MEIGLFEKNAGSRLKTCAFDQWLFHYPCTTLSTGAKTYLLCYISIFLFSAFTERLDGCLYKCGCIVKFSIQTSTMRKKSFFFQSLRACTPAPSLLHHRLQYVWSASSTIFRHLVKSILDGSLYLGPSLKSDHNPLSWIQVRSPVTT